MIIYHELRHYVDDLYNKQRYFSDFLDIQKIASNKSDDIKILNKIIYMVVNIYPNNKIGLDSTFNNYRNKVDIEQLKKDLKDNELVYNTIIDIYNTIKTIDYDYYLDKNEYYVRLNHLRRYLIKNKMIKVDEKLTKEHFINLIKDKHVLKSWLNNNIDFFYVLIYTDFDILSKRKTLKDIEIERKINTLL